MGRILTSIILLIVGAALGAAGMYYFFPMGGNADVATSSYYGDWRLNCPAADVKDQPCELVQSLTDNRTGEVLFRIAIRKSADGEEMSIIAPFGILLQPGLGIALGETEPKPIEIQFCDEAGCRAVVPIDDKFFSAIRTREMGTVSMTDFNGKMVSLPISLKGLPEGLSALRAHGSNASLLDRLGLNLSEII